MTPDEMHIHEATLILTTAEQVAAMSTEQLAQLRQRDMEYKAQKAIRGALDIYKSKYLIIGNFSTQATFAKRGKTNVANKEFGVRLIPSANFLSVNLEFWTFSASLMFSIRCSAQKLKSIKAIHEAINR